MANLLPRIIALKSPHFNAYLRYNNDSDSGRHGFSIFDRQISVSSPETRFEVVPANTDTRLVHIRSLHNGKFLRQRLVGSHSIVVFSPEADEPDEDTSDASSCTLFEPQGPHFDTVTFTEVMVFAHGLSGIFIHALINPLIQTGKIFLGPPGSSSNSNAHISVIDLESLTILPRHVVLKGDNGHYLQHTSNNQLRFMSDDKGHEDSWFEVSTDRDGVAEIKVFHRPNSYLRFNSNDNRIIADPSPSGFRPVKVDASTVALICLSNNKFCTRYTNILESGLSALDTSHSMMRSSLFTLEELVVSRTVYNTVFHLQNAVIYGETPVAMATVNASNNSSEPNKVNLNFTYTNFQSSTWGASHSWMVRAKVRIRVGIPFIKSGTVTVESEYSGSYEWEEIIETEKKFETTYTVTVPAHTSISVSLLATKGQCDVPYTYYQRDLLYNGRSAVYRKDDGMYTGINAYNFHYEVATLEEPDSKASLLYKSQILPHPTWIGPSKVQKIPLPTDKTLETTTELQADEVASTAKKGKDSTAVSPMSEPVLQGDDVASTAMKGKDSTAVSPMPEPILQGDDVA